MRKGTGAQLPHMHSVQGPACYCVATDCFGGPCHTSSSRLCGPCYHQQLALQLSCLLSCLLSTTRHTSLSCSPMLDQLTSLCTASLQPPFPAPHLYQVCRHCNQLPDCSCSKAKQQSHPHGGPLPLAAAACAAAGSCCCLVCCICCLELLIEGDAGACMGY